MPVRLKRTRLRFAALALAALTFTYFFTGPPLWGERGYSILEERPSFHDGRVPEVRFGEDCSPFTAGVMRDVTIVLKMGAGEVATRLPSYLGRLAHCKPDLLIFSDRKDEYYDFDIIDSLADLRPEYKAHNPDFDVYERIQNTNTTKGKSEEGWRLDKYKFLPMMEWTSHMRPESQWFVFVELDTYVNYDNMYRFLTYFSPSKAHYFGSPVWPKGKPTFAHGGSGFVLSRGALDKITAFGRKYGDNRQSPGSHFFGQEVRNFCCGDEVLARVLKQSGVTFRGYWPMFNGEKPTTLPFDKEHWCEAILTMHHLGEDDFTKLTEWETARSQRSRPLTFESLYAMIEPQLEDEADDWTNLSVDVVYLKGDGPAETFEECYKACLSDGDCLQFEHSGTECGLGYSIRLGHKQLPEGERKWTSGRMKVRIEAFKKDRPPCQGAHFVQSNP